MMKPQSFMFLIALLSLIKSTAGDICPSSCHCSVFPSVVDKSSMTHHVNCSGQHITNVSDVVSMLGLDTVMLDLSFNNIQSLPSYIFSHLKNLSVLLLHNNLIEELKPNVFRGLQQLHKLNLRNNRIVKIKGNAFYEMAGDSKFESQEIDPSSCNIDLTENNITHIEQYAFAWLTRTSICLGKSQVPLKIEAYAFYGAQWITQLEITNLPSLLLHSRFFTNVEGLKILNISNTKINKLNGFVFEGLKNVEHLVFTNVSFFTINRYAFSGMQFHPESQVKSEREKASSSSPRQQNSGGYIRFVQCSFQFLPTDAFRDTNLAILGISNSTIDLIQEYAFRGLNALRNLYFAGNRVKSMTGFCFGSISNLDEMHLEENDFGILVGNSFPEVKDIRSLRITVMTDLVLETEVFSGALNIKTLEVGGTKPGVVLTIREGAFQNLVSVDNLVIRNMELPSLEPGTFAGMTKIRNLQIAYCNVSWISRLAFGDQYGHQGAVDNLIIDTGNNLTCDCYTNAVVRHLRLKFINYNVPCKMNGQTIEADSEMLATICLSNRASIRSVSVILLLLLAFLSLNLIGYFGYGNQNV